ncbi:hypothetical protein AVEN_76893-1 [Araneus ventricosus]|uniref:Uncharacterized protein n=1 Tax=Araneus ventricosus TaxID=182803 RepID=A0A4Y2MG96_ARAVE|nr:hypothetical protein AVEN_76893-1 [Araneus ventricosus]
MRHLFSDLESGRGTVTDNTVLTFSFVSGGYDGESRARETELDQPAAEKPPDYDVVVALSDLTNQDVFFPTVVRNTD